MNDQAMREALEIAEKTIESMLSLWDRTRESGALPIDYVRARASLAAIQALKAAPAEAVRRCTPNCEKILAEIAGKLEAVKVPEGMVIVPMEPTGDMVREATYNTNRKYRDDPVNETIVRQVWRTMLWARPVEALNAMPAAPQAPDVCNYPDCKCPVDAPNGWCAKGFPQLTEKEGGEW